MTIVLEDVLQRVFGFKAFRPGQREAITALLENGRLLCIQPTGHGKSLLYQLPTCILEGITLVISPLLALMRDQIGHLQDRFHIPAASLNTDQTDEENEQARQAAICGEIRVLFVSPEQLDHIERFNFLLNLPLSLLVIDEAHCISTWGHDFRPGYRQILHFIRALEPKKSPIKILGLTATADEHVEADVKKQLGDIQVLRESMDRPNIYLSVVRAVGTAAKLAQCERLLAEHEGSGIIYCATRENSELVAEYLQQKGCSAIAYHAGFESDKKRQLQSAFLNDEYKVVAATTALGMGIDKTNLRFVIHFDIPGSITAYYQEVGRCGRDGLKAEGILIYDPADKKIQEHFIDSALPAETDFEKIFAAVKGAEEAPNLTTIRRLTGLHPTRVMIVMAELVEQNAMKKESVKGVQVYRTSVDNPILDLTRFTTQHLVKTQELNKLLHYADQRDTCRMAILRESLGDVQPLACGRCDTCLKTSSPDVLSLGDINRWLSARPVPIAAAKTQRLSEGLSALDGKLRAPLFIRFMKARALIPTPDPALLELLKRQVSLLHEQHTIAALIFLPSRTWTARDAIAQTLADHLQVPSLPLLSWESPSTHATGRAAQQRPTPS